MRNTRSSLILSESKSARQSAWSANKEARLRGPYGRFRVAGVLQTWAIFFSSLGIYLFRSLEHIFQHLQTNSIKVLRPVTIRMTILELKKQRFPRESTFPEVGFVKSKGKWTYNFVSYCQIPFFKNCTISHFHKLYLKVPTYF